MLTKQALINQLWHQKECREILTIIDHLELSDSWLCAGTLRNFVWHYLSPLSIDNSFGTSVMNDVDIVFYDPQLSYEETTEIEALLKQQHPQYQWELKNQVYMHRHNPNTSQYSSSQDAIAKFPETCTAIGARLHPQTKHLELYTPYGIEDLTQFIVRPTPYFAKDEQRMAVYRKRIAQKAWKKTWPNLIYKD